MKFMYIGDEPETVVFGLTFKAGEAVEVTDEHAIRKLKGNSLFTHDEAVAACDAPAGAEHVTATEEAPKRRGRPPNATQ